MVDVLKEIETMQFAVVKSADCAGSIVHTVQHPPRRAGRGLFTLSDAKFVHRIVAHPGPTWRWTQRQAFRRRAKAYPGCKDQGRAS